MQCRSAAPMPRAVPARALGLRLWLLALQSGFLVLFQTTCMAFSSLHQLAFVVSETGTACAGGRPDRSPARRSQLSSLPPGVSCRPRSLPAVLHLETKYPQEPNPVPSACSCVGCPPGCGDSVRGSQFPVILALGCCPRGRTFPLDGGSTLAHSPHVGAVSDLSPFRPRQWQSLARSGRS